MVVTMTSTVFWVQKNRLPQSSGLKNMPGINQQKEPAQLCVLSDLEDEGNMFI
jgi:hypothetical protein